MTNESYDRELIARMLADYATFAKTEFQLGPVWAQIEALRAADRSSYREAEPAAKVIAAEGFYGVGGWIEQPKDARNVKGLKGLRGLPIGTLLYPHPAADALGTVRELVAKWRDAAEGSTDSPNPTVKAVARCHIELATELESALAQAPAVRVADEMANLRSAIMRLDGQSRRDTLVAYRKLEAALGQGKAS